MTTRRPRPRDEAARRPHLSVVDHHLANRAGAMYVRHDDGATIFMAPDLDPVTYDAYLAHELEHDDLGVVRPPATDATMERVEHIVDQRTARWLVPQDELLEFVQARSEIGEPTEAHHVAEQWGVTEDLAGTALAQLQAKLLDQEYRAATKPPTPRHVVLAREDVQGFLAGLRGPDGDDEPVAWA